jgi:hypothetical protein
MNRCMLDETRLTQLWSSLQVRWNYELYFWPLLPLVGLPLPLLLALSLGLLSLEAAEP